MRAACGEGSKSRTALLSRSSIARLAAAIAPGSFSSAFVGKIAEGQKPGDEAEAAVAALSGQAGKPLVDRKARELGREECRGARFDRMGLVEDEGAERREHGRGLVAGPAHPRGEVGEQEMMIGHDDLRVRRLPPRP